METTNNSAAYKSKLLEGQVPLTLKDKDGEDETLWLVPSMRAMTTVNRNFNGLGEARRQLAAENFEAALFVMRHGLNVQEKDMKAFSERVYRNGLTADVLIQLIKFVAVLGNGGRALPEDEEEGNKEETSSSSEASSGNYSPSMSG